jgi:hypothetical protein
MAVWFGEFLNHSSLGFWILERGHDKWQQFVRGQAYEFDGVEAAQVHQVHTTRAAEV